MMRWFRYVLVLGLAHGVADGATGYLLGYLPDRLVTLQVGLLVLLFNGLAFGSQPLVGLFADRIKRPTLVAIAGLLLHSLGLLSVPWQPALAVALAGMGSAAFHVGGGALAVNATKGRAVGPGIFAAPGVIGVAVGGALAITGQSVSWLFLILLLILAAIIWLQPQPALPYRRQPQNHQPDNVFEGHDAVMLLLLLAIALRSVVWTTFQFLLEGQVNILLILGLSAAIGKIVGGVMGDWIGWRRWAFLALIGASVLLTWAEDSVAALAIGLALLQSATPIALAATAQLIPSKPAFASGLALGFAITIGGLPPMMGLSPRMGSPPVVTVIGLAAAVTLWLALNRSSVIGARGNAKTAEA
jgi:FSR family fosmidomycin resistance protein-like MFS transporter